MTDDWFACIAFCLVWTAMAALMVYRCIKLRLKPGKPDVPAFVFWAAICLAALVSHGIHAQTPWFLIVGIVFAVGTLYVTAAEGS